MIPKKYERKKFSVFCIIFLILCSSLLIITLNHYQLNNSTKNNKIIGSDFNKLINPRLEAQETLTAVWLENPTFESPIEPTWYSEVEGDHEDVEAIAGLDHVDLRVVGDQRIFTDVLGVPNSTTSQGWINVTHPDSSPLPDFNEIDEYGCEASHTWIDPTDPVQSPKINWEKICTMDVDMSDYIITSASISAVFNASAQTQSGSGGSNYGLESKRDSELLPGTFSRDYDKARFYVEISDLENNEKHEIAYNQTVNLGQDLGGNPIINTISNTFMETVEEETLKYYLTQLFKRDSRHFKIILGIDIMCIDNYNLDRDEWTSLRINECNLTFTYEKKIDQFSTVSWNQDGGIVSNISSDVIIINEAKLNFKYKSDYNWTDESLNSEIQAYINNNKIPLSESLKLINIEANDTFQLASKTGGFDVTSLIPYNTEINFSIELYLADEFLLDQNITFSIDDVYLNITYTVEFPDYQTNLQVFFNGNDTTSFPFYNHPVGNDLNITVKYPDDMGNHISGAVVELFGNLTGDFIENENFEQYTIIIDSNDLNVGTYDIRIVAHRINYKISTISAVITVIPTGSQELQLFLNGENKTSIPSFDISLDKLLNITIKYYTSLGTPVTGATVSLIGEGILENLNESISYNQYSIILNTSSHLKEGDNPLTISANKLNHEEKFKYPRINVRKIISLITPINNTNTISTQPGGNAYIQVYINNTDFNELIKGANVTLSCDFESNKYLEDPDNDGIYVYNLTDIPSGTHSIIINARGKDKYNFVSLEIIVAAVPPVDRSFIFRILLIVAIIASIALASYVYAYQKVLKFPRVIRKVRKYRRTLKSSKAPRLSILDRKKGFDSVYQKELITTSRFLKVKTKKEEKEEESPEKVIKKVPESSEIKKPDQISNKNSYNINKKNKDKTSYQISFRRRFNINLKRKWTGSLRMKNMRRILFLIIILTSFAIYYFIISPNFSQNSIDFSENPTNFIVNKDFSNLGLSAQESNTTQWLDNTNFSTSDNWISAKGTLGDPDDVDAHIGGGSANYFVIGGNHSFTAVSGTPNSSTSLGWYRFNNPKFPADPDTDEINSEGCFVSHEWTEGGDSSPSVHWEKNVSMPADINMSEYIITSASLSAVISATVTAYPGGSSSSPSGYGIEVAGDDTGPYQGDNNQFNTGDYIRFYVLLSDLAKTKNYEAAWNKTVDLGKDSAGATDTMTDTLMTTVSEEELIFFLTSALSSDYHNFTITLGIRIWCEDNWYSDRDRFDEIYIKSCNLTFTYVKKINQFTSVSWNQNAEKVSSLCNENETVIVDEALLNFKYKINETWPSTAPNSEIRILINDNQHPETIKLSNAGSSFQEVDFDVTPLVLDDVNLSIQVFIADDDFGLDRTFNISIDDVTLNISYTIIYPDIETELRIFLDGTDQTDNPILDIEIGDSVNITAKYLNITGTHVPNATVQLSGNFTGTLEEDEILKQYTIIINTDSSDAGVNFLTITAQAENHETKEIIVRLNVAKFESDNMQIFLNNQDVSPDPYIELIKSQILNISIKYTTIGGTHISGATVLLRSETYSAYLNESASFELYYIIINTTDRLDVGDHFFTVEAQSDIYKTQGKEITVSIRKINLEIISYSGMNTIETRTGANIRLKIRLNNTDFGGDVLGALVRYTWEGGSGILNDDNNDGIYEDTIPDFPEGTYEIKIIAQVGDDYSIENYKIVASATSEEAPENIIFPILLGVSIAIISGLAIYLYAYYAYLRFPRQVRKVRKYRKTLNRRSAPSVSIMDRESAFQKKYSKEVGKTAKVGVRPKLKKPTSSEQEPLTDMVIENQVGQKIQAEKLIKQSVEKKVELDKLIDESLDEKK
ncbi:MAG: hypothetical protein ACFFDH_14455 [Promethearchaeota archaeon]